MKIVCDECDYKFKSNKIPSQCPYCGVRNRLSEIADAEELVGEA